MYMHVFYKKYKHSFYFTNIIFFFENFFLRVYQNYRNNFLVLFYNYFTTLAKCWANDVSPTILGTRVEVIS